MSSLTLSSGEALPLPTLPSDAFTAPRSPAPPSPSSDFSSFLRGEEPLKLPGGASDIDLSAPRQTPPSSDFSNFLRGEEHIPPAEDRFSQFRRGEEKPDLILRNPQAGFRLDEPLDPPGASQLQRSPVTGDPSAPDPKHVATISFTGSSSSLERASNLMMLLQNGSVPLAYGLKAQYDRSTGMVSVGNADGSRTVNWQRMDALIRQANIPTAVINQNAEYYAPLTTARDNQGRLPSPSATTPN